MSSWRTAFLASLVSGTSLNPGLARRLQDPDGFEDLANAFEDDLEPLQEGLQARYGHLVEATRSPAQDGWALSHETLNLVTPLAERLGLAGERALLEDASFRLLDPLAYGMLAQAAPPDHPTDLAFLDHMLADTRLLLDDMGVRATVAGGVKSLWSVHRKMQKRGLPFEGVTDRIGLRVVIDDETDCYALRDHLLRRHELVDGSLRDYVANPKPNGYQSLHAAVRDRRWDMVAEFQLRTRLMHEHAEHGDAAHWVYKLAV